MKQQAGGVFDALLQKSQSVWAAIGNSFKTAMLTAIKEVVTSQVARMLMGMFGARGGGAAGGSGGGGGWASAMGGFGAILSGGEEGGYGWSGGGGGSTPPFLPGGGTGGSGGAGWGSMATNAKGWLTNLGNIGYGPKGGDFGGEVAGSYRGVGGAKGGAMLAGGAILAMDGLRRGGKLGVAETTAGGALIGAKFGGPVGAAIGAAVGFAAGMVRLFIKGAQEKAREKIKATYGVDMADRGILKQIVDTAKSAFGGNLDLAIQSPQIRELIELYSMATGQKTTGMPGSARPTTLVQSGGSMYESQGFSNGSPLPSSGGLDSIGAGRASSAPPVAVSLNIDGRAVGTAIIQNGRVVVEGAISALKGNSGRRQMTALQMSPGTITA